MDRVCPSQSQSSRGRLTLCVPLGPLSKMVATNIAWPAALLTDRVTLRRVVKPPVDARSDDALVRSFLDGEQAALGELLVRYERLVFSLVRRYARTSADAADLTQRSFLKALGAAQRSLPRLEQAGPGLFKAWLLRIAVNVGKNHARDGRHWRLSVVAEEVEQPSLEPGAPERISAAEDRERMRAAVLQLPRRQREVLTLRVDGELPFAEVAQTLGITENNAKVHFHHAMKRLQVLLAEEA